jgi:hypothetical protein
MSISATQLHDTLLFLNSINRAVPGYRVAANGHEIVFDEPGERATYFFTKEETAMHPGVVRRTFFMTNEGVSIRTEGRSFGIDRSELAFKRWFDALRAQSAEIQARLRKGQWR